MWAGIGGVATDGIGSGRGRGHWWAEPVNTTECGWGLWGEWSLLGGAYGGVRRVGGAYGGGVVRNGIGSGRGLGHWWAGLEKSKCGRGL